MKDGGYRGAAAEPAYAAPARGPAGNCYFRTDVGYSWSKNPEIKWYVDNSATGLGSGEAVSHTSLANGWLGEVGVGCGSGSYGVRGEVMMGYHGSRQLQGEPIFYAGPGPAPVTGVDPLHSSVKSYTLMANAYKDFGNFGGLTPYVGAGVGLAYNRMDETYFTGNPFLTSRIQKNDDLALAWSLMAGVGYQVSDRAVLDFGYRYMDLGKVTSGNVDDQRNFNPRVRVDELVSHEFKVGLRYHFGAGQAAMPAYAPMK
jgi:opacity protein-like surface antigen